MKKLLTSIVLFLSLTTMAQTQDEVYYILTTTNPRLAEYYSEGVLKINSIDEIYVDGRKQYDVDYEFIRFYPTTYSDKVNILSIYYPEISRMYVNGLIDIIYLYKGVNEATGEIECHVSYRRHYRYYPNVHIYYTPPRPPRPIHRTPPPPQRPKPNYRRPERISRPHKNPPYRHTYKPQPQTGTKPSSRPHLEPGPQRSGPQHSAPHSGGKNDRRR